MNLSRRNLGLFAGAALSAITANTAKADTPFTTFAFPATGSPTSRTEPNRWADWHNVLDFGADPTGALDSTSAVQAAINWTANDQRGTIYFPRGAFKITGPLSIYFGIGSNQSIILRGEGAATQLIGTFSGFVIDRYDPTWATPSGVIVIEKLFITNGSTTVGTGAIRLGNCNGAVVRDCILSGMNGVQLNQADLDPTFLSNNCSINNCTFLPVGAGLVTGSTAVTTGNGTSIINLDCSSWDCAVRMCGTGNSLVGGRMEVNNYSIIFGVDQLGNASSAVACLVGGFTTESFHTTGFDFVNADGCCMYEAGGSTFSGASYGLRLRSGVSNCTFQGVGMSGGYSVNSISIEDSTGSPGRGNTFIGCSGLKSGVVDWAMPTLARTAQFINSNNPVASFLFAKLPSGADVVVGDEYLCSNSSIATSAANFGSNIAGGGANTARVRWNGSNWIIV